jgi:hypothetical protein
MDSAFLKKKRVGSTWWLRKMSNVPEGFPSLSQPNTESKSSKLKAPKKKLKYKKAPDLIASPAPIEERSNVHPTDVTKMKIGSLYQCQYPPTDLAWLNGDKPHATVRMQSGAIVRGQSETSPGWFSDYVVKIWIASLSPKFESTFIYFNCHQPRFWQKRPKYVAFEKDEQYLQDAVVYDEVLCVLNDNQLQMLEQGVFDFLDDLDRQKQPLSSLAFRKVKKGIH